MFLAHKNDVDNNHYKPLVQFDNKSVLVNSKDIKIVSNVCPHQKSLLATCEGKGSRVCPYHGWSFDIDGNPIGSGLSSCKNSKPLDTSQVYEWNNLLFSCLVDFPQANFIDTSYLTLIETRIDQVKANSSNIMDLFLDVDHIELVHQGVYDQIGMPDIRQVDWHFYNNGSLQLVPGPNGYGAAWMAVYPGTMIEWQTGAMFITVAKPVDANTSSVIVYKYKDSRSSDAEWKMNSDIWETAWSQDSAQAELITEFNQDNLEQAKIHFRTYLSASSSSSS
jgi:phenylpropionate dioxygenase-like ring-hydroxylating dioxygenase large terminal subunit